MQRIVWQCGESGVEKELLVRAICKSEDFIKIKERMAEERHSFLKRWYNVSEEKNKRRRMRHLFFFVITSKQSAKQTISTECEFASRVKISEEKNKRRRRINDIERRRNRL